MTHRIEHAPPIPGESIASVTIWAALSHTYRHAVLEYLLECQDPSLRELSAYVADTFRGAVSEERVRLALYHHHLPMLRESALIAYDEHVEAVTLLANRDQLASHLELRDSPRTGTQ